MNLLHSVLSEILVSAWDQMVMLKMVQGSSGWLTVICCKENPKLSHIEQIDLIMYLMVHC